MADYAGAAWPFLEYQSNAQLKPDRFYGFSDSGGLVGKHAGYVTADEAVADITRTHYDDEPFDMWGSTLQHMLGSVACCVLSGLEFVQQAAAVDDLSLYGRFVGGERA